MVTATKNVFVTFGAGRTGWIGAAKRITKEAEKSNLFDFCFNLNEEWLKSWDAEIYGIGLRIRKTQLPRGFGYWTWKPSVVLWAHLNFPNHQIVYIDSGSEFQFEENRLQSLKGILNLSQQRGGLAFSLPNHLERNWTKKDFQEKLNLSQNQLNSTQIQSGFLALPKSEKRNTFINRWRDIALLENGFYFTDEIRSKNDAGFIEHRHDQSIMSCLWKELELPSISDVTTPVPASSFGLISYRNNSSLRMKTPKILRNTYKYSYLVRDKIASCFKNY